MSRADLPSHLLAWLQDLQLSYPLRSIRRDFCNGFLVAEVLSKYYPADVSMNAFGSYGSLEKKKSNWTLLKKLFQRGEIPVHEKLIESVINAEEGAALKLLQKIYQYLEQVEEDSAPAVEQPEGPDPMSQQADALSEPQPLSWIAAGPRPDTFPVSVAAAGSPCHHMPAVSRDNQAGLSAGVKADAMSNQVGAGAAAAGLLMAGSSPRQQQEDQQPPAYVAAAWSSQYAMDPAIEWSDVPSAVHGVTCDAPPYSYADAVPAWQTAGSTQMYGQQQAYMIPQPLPCMAAAPAIHPAAAVYEYGCTYRWAPDVYAPFKQNALPYINGPSTHMHGQPRSSPQKLTGRAMPGSMAKAAPISGAQQARLQHQQACSSGTGVAVAQTVSVPHLLGAPAPADVLAASGQAPPSYILSDGEPAVAAAPLPRIEYDKRPRPAAFQPFFSKSFWELGRLGPDYYESAEWRHKWENLERQKEFGKAARAANQQKAAEQPAAVPKRKLLSSREKALEFARSLPKPGPAKGSRVSSAQQVAEQLSKLHVKQVPMEDKDSLGMTRVEFGTALPGT